MLTYRTGAAGAPSASLAMAAHLTERTLPVEQARLAEYYAQGAGLARALEMGLGCVPESRADMNSVLAAAIGVSSTGGFVTEKGLANILSGRRLDGTEQPGSQRKVSKYGGDKAAGQEDRYRIAYIDLTLSAPKHASCAFFRAETDAERYSIVQCHRDARDETLRYIESEICKAGFGQGSRRGHVERGHMAWITCDHFTSRPTMSVTRPDPRTGVVDTELYTIRRAGDPQLHSHCIIPNLMTTDSGRVLSIDRNRLRDRIHEFGALYQAILARNLRAIGIEAELDPRTRMARLPCVPEDLCKAFSKRTENAAEMVKEDAQKAGLDWDSLSPARQVAFLKAETKRQRVGKGDDLANMSEWNAQADRLGWTHKTAIGRVGPAPDRAERLEGAFQVGLRLFAEDLRKRAVVEGKDARLAMIRGLIHHGIESTDDVKALTREMAARGVIQDGQWTRVIWKETAGGHVKLTTELHAAQERELIDRARSAAADRSRALSSEEIAASVRRTGITFDGEPGAAQRDTIERIGTGGTAGAFVGVAGVGKTTRVLPVLVDAWQQRGYAVWGTANAWIQANALREAGIDGFRCRAIQPLLEQIEEGRVALDRNSVVVLDELSQIGTRQLLVLLRAREQHGFQLVMTGSERQCQSIEAGPVIELLRQAWGEEAIPEILTTVRQKSAEERHIAGLFHDGRVQEALDLKRAKNSAELVEGGYRQCVRRVAALYVGRRAANAHDAEFTITISAPTNADALEISREVRLQRRAMGEVGRDRMTGVQATDGRGNTFSLALAQGDKVRLFRQTRALFVTESGKRQSAWIGDNGSVREIVEIVPDKGLWLRGESGKTGFVSWDALRDQGTKIGEGGAFGERSQQRHGVTSSKAKHPRAPAAQPGT